MQAAACLRAQGNMHTQCALKTTHTPHTNTSFTQLHSTALHHIPPQLSASHSMPGRTTAFTPVPLCTPSYFLLHEQRGKKDE